MSRTLYLLRHGQTRYNAELRLQGRCNSELTAKGEAQALAMGARLAKLLAEPADWTLYASPWAGRARPRSGCASSLVWTKRVSSGTSDWWSWGWESGRVAGCPSCWRPTPSSIWSSLTGICRPRGESFQSIQGRALSWLQDERIAERAIVVSHGLFGAMLRGAYADLDYTTTWLQELPQDAFFKLSGGRIERIPADPDQNGSPLASRFL